MITEEIVLIGKKIMFKALSNPSLKLNFVSKRLSPFYVNIYLVRVGRVEI